MRARPFLLCVILLVLGRADAGHDARAQEPPQPTFRTEANYVRVDVYPTLNGTPLTDLQKDDFEVLEQGEPQTIDAFEHVKVSGSVPQAERREPSSVAESRALVENPRARVFVIFLDYYHVDVAGSSKMREMLVNALDRFLGADDLFAVMTPEMSARDLSFARKTTTTRGMLERYWTWGERDQLNSRDPQDELYRQCYPVKPGPQSQQDPRIAEEMIERRREKLVLDALQDVVRSLRGAREERKAVLTISNGWRLFRRNPDLKKQLGSEPPSGLPPITVDPRTGRISTENTSGVPGSGTQAECERARMFLADLDNADQFREIGEEANRSNATFYPLDPRGLTSFDEPIMKLGSSGPPPAPTPPSVDRARLNARIESLRALAADTDGFAVVQTNDLERGFQRIVADLSSYYLLGYYSTRRMDGRFHPIRVRIKRPGVQVRARRGYLAPSAAEAATIAARAKTAPAAKLEPVSLESRAVESALAPLNSQVRERSVYLHAVAGWRPGGLAGVWAVGEVSATSLWKAGADVDVMLVSNGETLASQKVDVPAGTRTFAVAFAPAAGLTPGDYTVNVRAHGRALDVGSTTATLVVSLRAAPLASDAILVRRGATTGNREVRTADVRFRRTEQVGLDLPSAAQEPGQARLLGRNGQPLPLPVTVAVRDDPDGSRWQTARVSLAPLAPGDYVLEMTTGAERKLVGFRIIP